MGRLVARLRMPAPVAKGVKLLHIAKRRAGLLRDPGAQADFEGAMGQRIEGAGGERRLRACGARRHQDHGRVIGRRHDGGGQADFHGEGGMQGQVHAGRDSITPEHSTEHRDVRMTPQPAAPSLAWAAGPP